MGGLYIKQIWNIQAGEGVFTSAGFWGTVEALYPSCSSIASAAFRLATFLLGPVPVATSLFTFTCMGMEENTHIKKPVHTSEIKTLAIFADSQLNILVLLMHPVVIMTNCSLVFLKKVSFLSFSELRQPCSAHCTKRIWVKCLFFSNPKTLNLSIQNVSRNFQENIRRRYVIQTDNYTVQITFWEPKPVNCQASAHSVKVVWHAR